MQDCIFCKIIKGEIPAEKLLETEDLIAFRDINPQAPTHIIIIPKRHIDRIENLTQDDSLLMGKLITSARELAKSESLAKGYRLVFNNGADGGQEVEHLHLHLLGGRPMKWPPG